MSDLAIARGYDAFVEREHDRYYADHGECQECDASLDEDGECEECGWSGGYEPDYEQIMADRRDAYYD